MKLTQKQETFCLKYFELGNATEAALIAGYSPKYAATHTTRWLKMANIQTRISELRQKAEDEAIASKQELMKFHTVIIRSPHCPMCGTSPQVHQGIQIKASGELSKLGGYYVQPENEVNIDNRTIEVNVEDPKGKLISLLSRLAIRAGETGSDKEPEPERS